MNEPRNKVLNSLIEIALDQVFENLSKDPEVYKAVMAEVAKINIGESFDGSEIYLMIKLEGIVLNVFTQQGGQNKRRII